MFDIFFIMLPIFCVIFLGIIAEKYQFLPQETPHCVNQLVYWFSLPLLRFNILAQMRMEHISWEVLFTFVGGMMCTQYAVSAWLRLMKYNFRDSLVGGMIGGLSNAAFMGIPTIALLYPHSEQALVLVAFISMLPAISLVYTDTKLSLSDPMLPQTKRGFGTAKNIVRTLVCNPNLVASFIGICIGLSGIILPKTIIITTKMLGATAAPCALFCIGISLVRQLQQWHTKRAKRNIYLSQHTMVQAMLVLIKLFVCPTLMFIIGYSLGVRESSLIVVCIVGAMPTAIVGSIISAKHDVFCQEYIHCTLFSTCFSAISIPFVIILLQDILL